MQDYEQLVAKWERENTRARYLGEVAFAVGTVLVLLVVAALAKWWLP
jgi:hypothetical protein